MGTPYGRRGRENVSVREILSKEDISPDGGIMYFFENGDMRYDLVCELEDTQERYRIPLRTLEQFLSREQEGVYEELRQLKQNFGILADSLRQEKSIIIEHLQAAAHHTESNISEEAVAEIESRFERVYKWCKEASTIHVETPELEEEQYKRFN